MAFVNEAISEADVDLFNSYKLESPFKANRLIRSKKWTIDRERDAFLVSLGGQGYEHSEIPEFFALVWRKNVVIMEAFGGGVGSYSTGVELWWKITSIRVPEGLMQEKDTVIELIEEAFDVYGTGHDREHVKKVEFRFIATPLFILEVN